MSKKNDLMGGAHALGLASIGRNTALGESVRFLTSTETAKQIAAMQAVIKPFESMRKDLDALINPYRDIQAAIAASDPSRGMREAAAKLGGIDAIFQAVSGENMTSALKQMQSYIGITNVNPNFLSFDSPFQAQAKLIERLFSPNTAAAKYIEEISSNRAYMAAAAQNAGLISSTKAMQASLERLINPLGSASVRSYWESMLKTGERHGIEQLLDDSQLLGEEGASEEIGQLVHGVAEGISKALTSQEAVDQIVQGFKAAQEPLHRWILASIFLPILFFLASPFWNSYVDFHVKKNLEGTSTQATNKQVKEAAREAVGDLRLLRDYRFVTAQSLAVRAEPKARGQTLGQLRLGQTVHVLGKERDFTLVTWRSEDGNAQLQGWVFSRYLKRFQ